MGGVQRIGQEPVRDGVQSAVVPLPELGQRLGVTAGDAPNQVAIGGLFARLKYKWHPGIKTPGRPLR